ncbi:MAG: S-layer homology domain-containing protein, partial [Lachnospiraceae bacterium]|nr:S-layer homology domain-containing protein [Lachnospiraceae bacterium]
MLFRYARVKGLGTAVSSSIAYQEKADWKKVSGYAVTAVNWGYSNGFIGNGSDLKPQDNITRAEAATIMARFVVKYGI